MAANIHAHTDHGTVLQPDHAALVVDRNGELSMLYPHYADDETVPDMVALLAAVLIRSRDPEWVAEMIDTLQESC